MRYSKAELAALDRAAQYFEDPALVSLLNKLTPRAETPSSGPTVAQIEGALVSAAGGRCAPVQANSRSFWIIQARKWRELDVTLDQVFLVGAWLKTWPQGYTTTIDSVAYKWPQYLAKARASSEARESSKAVETDVRPDYAGGLD